MYTVILANIMVTMGSFVILQHYSVQFMRYVMNVFILPVGTDPTNLVGIQQDESATSISVTWELPTLPTPTASGFVVIYETNGSCNNISVDFCTECGTNISGLMTGSTYTISVITVSAHLPSKVTGPVVVTLG